MRRPTRPPIRALLFIAVAALPGCLLPAGDDAGALRATAPPELGAPPRAQHAGAGATRASGTAAALQPDFAAGLEQELAGRWHDARELYAAAGRDAPFVVVDAVLAQARTLLAEQRAADAAALLDAAARAAGADGALLKAAGDAVLASRGIEAALPYYQRAHAAAPGDVRVRLALAVASHAAGRHGDVVAVLAHDEPARLPCALRLVLGRSALLAGETGCAAAALDSYLAERPADLDARLDLARARLLLGSHAEAHRILQGVLADRPGWHEAYVLVGHVAMRAGQPDVALQWYEQAVELGADASELGLLMARLRHRSGGQP